jgi:hypothetical protein
MGEIIGLLWWAFRGKVETPAARLLQWWARLTVVWVGLLVLFELCVAVSVLLQPEIGNFFGAYLTLEAAAVLAMIVPLLLAIVLFVAYCAVRVLIFASLFIAALLGVIG